MAPRTPLSRQAVLDAAVALADAEGLASVSMRRLGQQLDVVPMALYKHVADKEDLLDGMVDTVLAEIGRPGSTESDAVGAGPTWRNRVRGTALAARAVMRRHLWARRAIESRTHRTAAVLRHMETVTSQLLAGGLTPDLTHHAMHALGNRIWGFSPELFDESSAAPARRRRRSESLDPRDFPGIMAVTADSRARRPDATSCDEDFEFEFALDLVLDGVERLHRDGWDSGPGRN